MNATALEAMLRHLKALRYLVLPASVRVDLTAPGLRSLYEERAGAWRVQLLQPSCLG